MDLYWECTEKHAKFDADAVNDARKWELSIFSLYEKIGNDALKTAKEQNDADLRQKQLTIATQAAAGMDRCRNVPKARAEAALLLGKFYEEALKQQSKAIDEYARGLPGKSEQPIQEQVGLQFRHTKLIFEKLMTEPQAPDLQKVEDLIQGADKSVEWASNPQINADPLLKANALYLAGYARTYAIAAAKRKPELATPAQYELAAEKLQEAIRIAPDNPDNGQRNRAWLALTYFQLLTDPQTPANKKQDYFEKASKWGKQAVDMTAPAAEDHENAKKLLERIERAKP